MNSSTNLISKTITVGDNPVAIFYDPDNKEIYVSDYGSNSVDIINSSTGAVIGNIQIGIIPSSITYNPTNKELYIINGDYFNLVHTTTNTVKKTIS